MITPKRLSLRVAMDRRGAFIYILLILCCGGIAFLFLTPRHSPDSTIFFGALLEEDLPLFQRDIHVEGGHNIFQLETHSNGRKFQPRTLCSLESYCRSNPSSTVWMLFIDSQLVDPFKLRLFRSLAAAYPNLRLARFNIAALLQGTPLENILNTERISTSKMLVYELSDLARTALIYKVGGFYSDFDILCFRDVSTLENFMVYESEWGLNSGVWHLKAGHPLLLAMMRDAVTRGVTDSVRWGVLGPILFTRVIRSRCGLMKASDVSRDPSKHATLNLMTKSMQDLDGGLRLSRVQEYEEPAELQQEPKPEAVTGPEECRGLRLLPEAAFAPLNWNRANWYFDVSSNVNLTDILSESVGVHFYHDMTMDLPVVPNSPFDYMAFTFCPYVHGAAHWGGVSL